MKLTKYLPLLLSAMLTALVFPAFSSPAHSAESATVSVLHAVPGQTVDVYANGDELITDFKPGTLTDPMQLPAGTYDLKIVAAGDGPDGTALAQARGVKVPAGANATVVAHLSKSGKPTLTPFVNDVSPVPAGQARLTVRHTAAAPAVDVRAAGKPVLENLTNPNEAKAQVPAGTIEADVTLAGTDTVAIGPTDLTLKEGTNTIVYAWGSAKAKNLELAVQTIGGMHSAPHGVPSGTGGRVAGSDSTAPAWALGLLALGGVGVAISTMRLTRHRSVAKR